MKRDREVEKARSDMERLSRLPNHEYLKAVKQQAAEERRQGSQYMQPIGVSWLEFLQHRNWTPQMVDELPDDYVFIEWGRYTLRIRYGQPM